MNCLDVVLVSMKAKLYGICVSELVRCLCILQNEVADFFFTLTHLLWRQSKEEESLDNEDEGHDSKEKQPSLMVESYHTYRWKNNNGCI